MSAELLPVETLERLSKLEGVDVRPILARVLTDLFVQKPHHAPDEIARFEELVLQLLDVVDQDTRAIVARKLADDSRAPPAVIARLLDDAFSVSAPLLARFPHVPRQILLTLALDGGPVEASAVASRAELDDDTMRLLARHPNDQVLEALAANPSARPGEAILAVMVARAIAAPALAGALLRRDDLDAAALAPLYLHADPDRRIAIRRALELRSSRPGIGRALRRADAVDAALVEAATHEGRAPMITDALADALALKPADASWLSTEPSGEGFVMMLRAAGVEVSGVGRALLLARPEIALSVAQFFALVDVAEATPRVVAAELLDALVGRVAPKAAAVRHEPLFEPLGVAERAGAARASPRGRTARERDGARRRG
jgi:uncharacterized protein (DUF2336 family)